MARPKSEEHRERKSFRLSPDEMELLTQTAERFQMTQTQVIVEGIRLMSKQNTPPQ